MCRREHENVRGALAESLALVAAGPRRVTMGALKPLIRGPHVTIAVMVRGMVGLESNIRFEGEITPPIPLK